MKQPAMGTSADQIPRVLPAIDTGAALIRP